MRKIIELRHPGSFVYIFLLNFIVLALPVAAQSYRHELAVTSDNDVYIAFLQDRYYTNGLLFHYRYASGTAKRKNNPKLEKTTTEFVLGQKIYTPYSAKAPDPALHDRPFTAYLYGAAIFNRFYENESMIRFNVEGGTTGRAAMGKEVQMAFHKMLGIYKPRGWEYQLNTEPALNLSADYLRLLVRSDKLKTDVSFTSAALLGNTFSGASSGVLLRFGKADLLYQSITTNSLISLDPAEKKSREFFLFANPCINYVAYDGTIQGGLFRKDKGPVSFGSEKFVYSQQIGVAGSTPRWSASYTIISTGKQVKSAAKPYNYASARLAYRFN